MIQRARKFAKGCHICKYGIKHLINKKCKHMHPVVKNVFYKNISWLVAAIACIFFLLIVMVARIATQKRQGLAPTSFFYILSSQSFCGPRNITVPYNCQAPFTLQELWRQLLHELFVPATQRIILKIVGFQMVAPRVLKPNYSCKWLTLQSCFFDNFL